MKLISKDNADTHPPVGSHEHETAGACVIIDEAIGHLRRTRDLLVAANAPRSAERVRRALKSVEGARRNADRFRCRTCDGQGRLENPHDLLGTETCPSCAGTGRAHRAKDSL